ncbi:DUF2332 domain-containing protein [Paenibacillus pasadenensis]|uniref:DUF2332 domain-containing protein n=1 Tax=Paenibacillus pasadenensis TaxID=217090 RepID=UPI00204252AF|nr:DUF2332 domain-containing protein [Paenibacillus pasadenensis]MCM3746102.1 DUF2332 domain-containing protein [Paenibacillus pasadenensis]
MEQLSLQFRRFAEECRESSPLYEHLAESISKDSELLLLAASARKGQPVPNLLFAAVHELLLSGSKHTLADYYASTCRGAPLPAGDAFPSFKSFCLEHRAQIEFRLQNRLVQTNEAGRCAYLYPAFCTIYSIAQKPLALIELGTSAGLQLMWHKYGYDYGDRAIVGNPQSELILHAVPKGVIAPPIHSASPPVAAAVGIDLHVNDLCSANHLLWLKALIWPEHTDRRIQLEQAAKVLLEQPPKLLEGDAVELLPTVAAAMPKGAALVVFHTHVANQFSADTKQKLIHYICTLGQTRDVYHLCNNMQDVLLHLDYWKDGQLFRHALAETEGHGRWFRWLES